MKKNTLIYWTTTGILSTMMLFNAAQYLLNPALVADFIHLGFPDYFRIELAVAKTLGALVLIIPAIPFRMKEWAYAGFGINFISASVAHLMSGDPVGYALFPLIFLVILVVSNVYLHKLNKPALHEKG